MRTGLLMLMLILCPKAPRGDSCAYAWCTSPPSSWGGETALHFLFYHEQCCNIIDYLWTGSAVQVTLRTAKQQVCHPVETNNSNLRSFINLSIPQPCLMWCSPSYLTFTTFLGCISKKAALNLFKLAQMWNWMSWGTITSWFCLRMLL